MHEFGGTRRQCKTNALLTHGLSDAQDTNSPCVFPKQRHPSNIIVPPWSVRIYDLGRTNDPLVDLFRHHNICISLLMEHELVIRKPLWKMLLLKGQDGIDIGSGCLRNRDRRAKTLVDPFRSGVPCHISDEIKAAFHFSPSTCLEEQPRVRQVGRHSLPEILKATAKLDLCYPSLFEGGKSMLVKHAAHPSALVGRGDEQGNEVSFWGWCSLASLGRNPADDLLT